MDMLVQAPERIRRIPGTFEGQPVIRDIRLPVALVLYQMAHGYTIDYLLDQYEGLTREDINECLAYAAKVVESNRL